MGVLELTTLNYLSLYLSRRLEQGVRLKCLSLQQLAVCFINCCVPSSSPKLVVITVPYLIPPPKTETWKALLQSPFASRKSRPLLGVSLLERRQHPPSQPPLTTSGVCKTSRVCKTSQSPCPSRDVLCIHFRDHSYSSPWYFFPPTPGPHCHPAIKGR